MNDDDYGAMVLRPLAGEPSGPPRIDVAKAMRDGRRLRRRRWLANWPSTAAFVAVVTTGGVLATTVGPEPKRVDLPPDPTVPAACAVATLPMGPHRSADVTGGDQSGRWLVGFTDSQNPEPSVPQSLLVWHDGKLVADVKPPDDGVRMSDVNASGVAVGNNDIGTDHPYAYVDGAIRQLAGGPGRAIAINDAGVVAGLTGPPEAEKPARWDTVRARPTLLALPPEAELGRSTLRVTDVTADGLVIGEIDRRTYVWPPDGPGRFVTPPLVGGQRSAYFTPGAYYRGWVYGVAAVALAPSTDPLRPGARAYDDREYRFHLPTGTWQALDGTWMHTQVAGSFGAGNEFISADPQVYVGRAILNLPGDTKTDAAGMSNYKIEHLSDDARLVAGTAFDPRANPDQPAIPIIWRCR